MKYKIVKPESSKLIRITENPLFINFVALILLIIFSYYFFLPTHGPAGAFYISLRVVFKRFLPIFIVVFLIPMLILYYSFRRFLVPKIYSEVDVSSDSFIYYLFSNSAIKIPFQKIKKVQTINKDNFGSIHNLAYDVKNVKGVNITYKDGFWINESYLFNIEGFENFMEELKTKIPHLLIY